MSWYAQDQYSELEGDNPSLVVAFANLLKKVEQDIDPAVLGRILTQDDPEIDWWSLGEYVPGIKEVQVEQTNSWPASALSIVQLDRLDPDKGEITAHFCLVADPLAKSVVDSRDGKIKNGSNQTLRGWATFEVQPDHEPIEIPEIEPVETRTNPERNYVVQQGETIWDVARITNTKADVLMEHNGISSPSDVEAGDVLHLPDLPPVKEVRQVRYELFIPHKDMHIIKSGGAKKWSFGNVKKWDDLYETGPTYQEHTNLVIHGVAHVPVGDETAAYYMDSLSIGTYRETGRVSYTTGYAWADVGDGHIYEPAPPPLPDDQVEIIVQPGWDIVKVLTTAGYPEDIANNTEAQLHAFVPKEGQSFGELPVGKRVRLYKYQEPEKQPEPEVESIPEHSAADDVNTVPASSPTHVENGYPQPEPLDTYPTAYKSTFEAWPTPMIYIANDTLMVKEFNGRRPDRALYKNTGIHIDGTFLVDGIMYGRPAKPAQNGYWFGIPMELLTAEEELYSTELDIPSKVAMHKHLTPLERAWYVSSKVHAKFIKLTAPKNKPRSK